MPKETVAPMEPLPSSGQPANVNENGELQSSDYDAETIEQLEERFARGEGEVSEGAEAAEPAPEAVPEPEPVAAEAESDQAPPVEDVPAEPAPEPEVDDRELQMQELQLQMERMRLDKQHFEHLAGKNATAVDDLRKELLTSAVRPAVEADPIYEDTQPSVAPAPRIVPAPNDGLADKVAELQQSQTAQETERVYNSFVEKVRSDLSTQGVKADEIETQTQSVIEQITPTLKQGFEPYGDLSTYSVKTLSKVTRMVLDSAYTDVKLAKVAELRRTNAERKATQIAETRLVKQAASPSGSGGRSVKEPPPLTVNPDTGVIDGMTAEEADAEMIRLEGDGGSLRP